MITDWYNSKLCAAWINEMGNSGDLPRQVFSIPIVLGLAKKLIDREPISSGLMKKSILNLTDKLNGKNFNYKPIKKNTSLNGLNCLDLGCGEGYLGRYLANLGGNYLGLDGSPHLIKAANTQKNSNFLKYELANLDFFDSNPKKNPIDYVIKDHFDSEKIDIIFCHSIIEHLIDFDSFFLHITNWAQINYPQAIISLICLDKQFLMATTKNNVDTHFITSAFSHCLEVPHTKSLVRINFFSDTDIKNAIESTNYKIIDTLNFTKALYSPSICSRLNIELTDGGEDGPFRAYLLGHLS